MKGEMKGKRILYPCYFDADLTRGQGRRVPAARAVKGPTRADLERSLKKQRISFTAEEKSHPGHGDRDGGRLVVSWEGSKEALIRAAAERLDVKKEGKEGRK